MKVLFNNKAGDVVIASVEQHRYYGDHWTGFVESIVKGAGYYVGQATSPAKSLCTEYLDPNELLKELL